MEWEICRLVEDYSFWYSLEFETNSELSFLLEFQATQKQNYAQDLVRAEI